MRNKLFAITAILVLVLSMSSIASAITIPEPTGNLVSDFANEMTPAEKSTLESKLRSYEAATSIEIAVITIPSLEGTTIEDYGIAIGRKWGVGKAGKDNGVLILHAPQERKIRIETGYGVEGDLPDITCTEINRQVMVPFLKEGKFGEALIAGADAIIKELGQESVEARLARKETEKAAQEARDKEARALIGKIFLYGVGIIALVGFFAFIFHRLQKAKAERLRLARINEANKNDFREIQRIITTLERDLPSTRNNLWKLSQNNLGEWTELIAESGNSERVLSKAKTELIALTTAWSTKGTDPEALRSNITPLLQVVRKLSSLQTRIDERKAAIANAEANGPGTLLRIKKDLDLLREKLAEKDIDEGTRKQLAGIEWTYSEAVRITHGTFSWFVLMITLTGIISAITKLKQRAENDQANARSRREEAKRPPRRQSSDDGWLAAGAAGSIFESNRHDTDTGGGSSNFDFGGGNFGGGGSTDSY